MSMGIYLPNMEMPRPKLAGMVAVYNAYVVVRHNGDAKIVVDNEDKLDSTEYSLIPVPPHGRLIDADALANKHRTMAYEDGGRKYSFHASAKSWVEEAPTIIPAQTEKEGE